MEDFEMERENGLFRDDVDQPYKRKVQLDGDALIGSATAIAQLMLSKRPESKASYVGK
jgi:hypothetical protein